MKLHHFPLEAYQSRYTDYLSTIEAKHFKSVFADYVAYTPQDALNSQITSGSVLDSYRRPVVCFDQIRQFLKSEKPESLKDSVLWFSDFYTAGLDAIPYAFRGERPYKAGAFLWAQTFDRFDFTASYVDWMRPWEVMASVFYDHIFVASETLKDLICVALPFVSAKVHTVGLPYDYQHLQPLGDFKTTRSYDCAYTSRWDKEKQPQFFLDIVENNLDLKFVVCTGHETLTGDDKVAIERATRLIEKGKLSLCANLSKQEYFNILCKTKVQLNTALQDWVSFTLLEALTFGCIPLYPAYRSFPEALRYNEDCLYAPFDLEAVSQKLRWSVKSHTFDASYGLSILDYHSNTLKRITDILQTKGKI